MRIRKLVLAALLSVAVVPVVTAQPADAYNAPSGMCQHGTNIYPSTNSKERWSYVSQSYSWGRHYHRWAHQFWNGSYWQTNHYDTVQCYWHS